MMRLFRRSRPTPGLRALCYGKLPFAKDFLVSRGGDAGRRFQDWLGALDRGARAATLPRPQRVIFAPPAVATFVVGTVWDSADAGGVRKFPFALYFDVGREDLGAGVAAPITAALDQWACLEREYGTLARAENTEAFFQALRGIRFERESPPDGSGAPADRFVRAAGQYTLRSLITGIYGADGVTDWVSLLWRFEQLLAAQEATADGSHPVAVRLPLAPAIPFPVQVEAWLHAIRVRIGDHAAIPSVIFPAPIDSAAPTNSGSFMVSLRLLRESDVALLQESAGEADVLDLTVPEGGDPVHPTFLQTVALVADDPAADLMQIMPPRPLGESGGTDDGGR